MTPEQLAGMRYWYQHFHDLRKVFDHIDQQAAELSRLRKLNADLSAGDVKEVCELREEVERKDAEISRLRKILGDGLCRECDGAGVTKFREGHRDEHARDGTNFVCLACNATGREDVRLRTAIVEAKRQVEVCQNVRHDYGGTEEMYLALVKLDATLAATGETPRWQCPSCKRSYTSNVTMCACDALVKLKVQSAGKERE